MSKEIAKLLRPYIKAGAIFRTGRKHNKLTVGGRTIPIPKTPSDHRALHNLRAQLKRLKQATAQVA